MVCKSSVFAFMANTSNSIMKSTMCFLPCLNVSIFHSASAALLLSLNAVLISSTNSSQLWILSVSFSSLIFFCVYIPAMPSLSQASTAVILSSAATTLLLLRNKWISLHQSSNFIRSPSNHPRSDTIFFSNSAWPFSWPITSIGAGAGATDISASVHLLLVLSFEASICKDPSHSDNASILSVCLELIVVLPDR